MPFMTGGKRNYKKELDWEHRNKPNRVKDRAARNKARAEEAKAGKVHKHDGLDVDHRVPVSKGGKTVPSNLRVVPASTNRSFSRNADGSLKSQVSKKERASRKKK